MTTCFIAGIVKGLVEKNDPYRHFGSLLNFKGHEDTAVSCGVITKEHEVTPLGLKWYHSTAMAELKDTRAYCWGKPDTFWSSTLTQLSTK